MKQQYNKKSKNSRTVLIPIALFMCFISFIVYLKVFNYDMSLYEWYSDTSLFSDFFTYYKSIAVITIAVITLFVYIARLMLSKHMTFDFYKFYYPLIGYFIFMVLSWIFSQYSHTSAFGYLERFEGGIILTSYLFMFFYMTQIIKSEYDIKWLIKVFVVAIVLMNVIGLLQYLKLDYMRNGFIQKLVLPKAYEKGDLNFTVGLGRVYMTLYHPNYVGLYISLVLPFVTTFFLCEKNLLKKALWGLLSLVILINLIGSESRGGLVGIAVAAVMTLLFLRKKIFKYWKVMLPILLACVAIVVVMDTRKDHYYSQRLVNTVKEAFGEPVDYPLDKLVTEGNNLEINYHNTPITVTFKDAEDYTSITFKDESDQVIDYTLEGYSYTLDHEIYGKVGMEYATYEEIPCLIFNTPDASRWIFAMTDDGFKYLNPFGKLVDLKAVDRTGFKGKERMGSARGYIWSRSIPMLKDVVYIGHGPDSYVYEFPQNDYLGKYNAYNTANMVVDKPHNIYLQIAINTGIISLIAMLVFWGMYIVSCFKLYFKDNLDDFLSIAGVALFLGICGYLGSGVFNDANVSISPLYWGMIGLGFSVNNIIKISRSKNNS